MDSSIAQRTAADTASLPEFLRDRLDEQERAIARANRVCTGLQERLFELEAALRAADERRAFDAAAAAEHLARRHTEFTASLAQAAQSRDALARQLQDTAAALDEAREQRAADAAAAADRVARREAELGDSLAEAVLARTAIEDALARTQRALEAAVEEAAAELAAARDFAEARERELAAELAQETAARKALTRTAAETQASLEESRRDRAAEAEAAAERLRQSERELQATLEESRRALAAQAQAAAEQLREREGQFQAAIEESRRARAADAEAAAERLREREGQSQAALEESRLARAAEADAAAERLRRSEGDLQAARDRAASDLAAAAAREQDLVRRLAEQAATQQALERAIADARAAASRARRRVLDLASALRARAREHRARVDATLQQQRADHERTIGFLREEIRQAEANRESLEQSLERVTRDVHAQREAAADERREHDRALAALESERQKLSGDYAQALQALEQLRAAFATLEGVSSEHAAERARLETVLAERETYASDLAARHLAAEDTAAALRGQLDTANQSIDALTRESDALKATAQRVPALQQQIDRMLAEQQSTFERAPYGLCRCTRDGSITRANKSLVRLLGYRSLDELKTVDFATAVFDCPGDLRWFIERAASNGPADWVDSTWLTRDRRRMAVRLQLQPAPDGTIDIAVEDVSRLRDMEERLYQAHRIEAVGRLASEVAATCETVLADVSRNGREWLAAIDAETPLRHQGDMLLSEVARAASFLRQLAVYGDRQLRVSDSVNLPRVLRDLAPVLRRVAGDDIDFVLPRASKIDDLVVDVDAERVERILVNVASYARQRMPQGGRVRIDVDTTKVDRRFVARHPNVRPGAHAVIGVTEVRAESSTAAGLPAPAISSDTPGVDLGALLGLIGGCGGHLWMSADPPGNMTLKIHLPRKVEAIAAAPAALVPPASAVRAIGRWFRH